MKTEVLKKPIQLLVTAMALAFALSVVVPAAEVANLAPEPVMVATATQPNPDHKVDVCHATNAIDRNGNRKYVLINVDIASSGYVKGGHHRGVDGFPKKHADGGDIIPPYSYGDFHYPGQNWTERGQAIWNNDCVVPVKPPKPPKPPKPEPELRIQVACVAQNSGGERKTVRTRVTYSTDGVQMVLFRRIVIDGQVRLNSYLDVWADDITLTTYRKVGYGKHRVRVVAKMGGIRVEKIKTVRCDMPPIVEVLGACGDPYYGVRVINRTADGKRLVVRLDGRVVVNRWVPRYSVVVTRAFFAEGGQRLTVRLDGKLVESEITKGGTFPWNTRECKILRAQVQTA